MKINFNQKSIIIAMMLLLGLFLKCREREIIGSGKAYSNPNDSVTTSIETNIIQIELPKVLIYKIDTNSDGEVKVYLSVTNQNGTPIDSLNSYNFEVEERTSSGTLPVESEEIDVTTVEQSGSAIATSMIMDYSGSMSGQPIVDMETAIKSFINNMQSGDKGEIIKFSDYPEVVQSFTTNKNALISAVDEEWPGAGGSTALYDAIYLGLTDTYSQSGMKAVLAFTDGCENASVHSKSELLSHADALRIAIYTIGLGGVDEQELQELANYTGGRYFYAPTSQDLKDIYDLISGQLRKSYVLKWAVKSKSGLKVTLSITTTYTGGNGTFSDIATGEFTAP